MKNSKICLYVILVMILLACLTTVYGDEEIKAEPTMKIYFHEFKTRMYRAITPENIDEYPSYKIWFYGKHEFINKIRKVLEGTKTEKDINSEEIRLKVVIKEDQKNEVYLADYYGIVLRMEDQNKFVLSEEAMIGLEKDIIYFHGVVDKMPHLDPYPR